MRKRALWLAAAILPLLCSPALAADEKKCFECHSKVERLFKMGSHTYVACEKCHGGLDAHLADQKPETRPTTDTSWRWPLMSTS